MRWNSRHVCHVCRGRHVSSGGSDMNDRHSTTDGFQGVCAERVRFSGRKSGMF